MSEERALWWEKRCLDAERRARVFERALKIFADGSEAEVMAAIRSSLAEMKREYVAPCEPDSTQTAWGSYGGGIGGRV